MPHPLLTPLENHGGYTQLQHKLAHTSPQTLWANGPVSTQKWHLAAGLMDATPHPTVIIAPSAIKAKEIFGNMYYFFRDRVLMYPSRDLLFYAADVKSVDITRQRMQVIDKLRRPQPPGRAPIIVLTPEALLDRMTPPATFHRYKMEVMVGDMADPADLIKKLTQMGYTRSAQAEGPGQYAMRGGILDIYPAVGHYDNMALQSSQAIRIEFFDTDVDSIRIIDALSQRSIENAKKFEIYPVTELVFSTTRLAATIDRIKEAMEAQAAKLPDKEAEMLKNTIGFTLDNWSLGIATGADPFLPFFYPADDEVATLLDYLPPAVTIYIDNPNATDIHIQNIQEEYAESIAHRLAAGRLLPAQADVIVPWEKILHQTTRHHRILFSSMSGKLDNYPMAEEVLIRGQAISPLRHKPEDLKRDLEIYIKQG